MINKKFQEYFVMDGPGHHTDEISKNKHDLKTVYRFTVKVQLFVL